jgi:hypothetical protein
MGSERALSDINFFICSTYLDLQQHRNAVIERLQRAAGVINAQEFFGARAQRPLSTCLEELEKSQVFVMLLGPRYGSIEPESGRSYVELEYERATDLGLPKFAYVIDERHPFPIEFVSKGEEAEKLSRFKDRVRVDLTIDQFTTPHDIAEKVFSDLKRELPKKGFRLGDAEVSPALSSEDLLERFVALPKLFAGRTLELPVKLGKYKPAPGEEVSHFEGKALRSRWTTNSRPTN